MLRLLSYNIRYGGSGREDALADVITHASPDLVVFQEATKPAVIEQLAQRTGMAQWGSRRGQSLGFMSRRPVTRVEWHKPPVSRHAFLEIEPDVGATHPPTPRLRRDLAEAQSAKAGASPLPWRVFGVHLSAVHAAWTEHRRAFELRALLATIARHQPGPHALVGDFNTLAPGELLDIRKLPHRLRALVWLSGGRIRWRTIQTVLDAGYVDAFRHRQPDLVGNTFPTWDPHARLDYLFVPGSFVDQVRSCAVMTCAPAPVASDHFPLLSELDV